VGDLLYLTRGNIFEEVNNAFAVTDRNPASRLTTNNGRMSFGTNELVIVLVDGTNGYNYTIATNAFAQIASAMFANPQTTTYQDGYWLASFLETGPNKKRCQISADGITWNALDFRAIDTIPGALIRTLSFQGEVHQFGDKGIEFWAYTGDPTFPFQPIRGATLKIGLAARWSVGEGAQCLYFLGRKGGKGEVQVYQLDGHQARSISTPELSNAINKLRHEGRRDGLRADDRRARVLSHLLPGRRQDVGIRQLRLDLLGVPVWEELQSNGGRHLGDLGFTLVDKDYVSDYGAGKLYRVDKDVYTDNGAMIVREVDTRHFFKDYDRVTVDELVADFETGVGLAVGQGVDPQVMISISRDGGRTWGAQQHGAARQGRRIHEARGAAPPGHGARLRLPDLDERPGEILPDRPWHPHERRAGEAARLVTINAVPDKSDVVVAKDILRANAGVARILPHHLLRALRLEADLHRDLEPRLPAHRRRRPAGRQHRRARCAPRRRRDRFDEEPGGRLVKVLDQFTISGRTRWCSSATSPGSTSARRR
jgi:hypothetical protein